MKYIGEHLLPGQLGHFLIVLSLVASLVACIAYFKASNATIATDHESWKKLARIAFLSRMPVRYSPLSAFFSLLLLNTITNIFTPGTIQTSP